MKRINNCIIYTLATLFLAINLSFAQNVHDSLLNLIPQQTDNRSKALIYCDIAKYAERLDTITKYSDLAIEYAEGDAEIIARAMAYHAFVAGNQCDFEKALSLYNEAYELCKDQKKSLLPSKMLINAGAALEEMNDLQGALQKYNQALDLSISLGDTLVILSTYKQLCQICAKAKLFGMAVQYSNAALELCRTIKRPEQLVIVYASKAMMYDRMAETKQAKERDSISTLAIAYCDSAQNVIERTRCDSYECQLSLNHTYCVKAEIYIHQANVRSQNVDSAKKYLDLFNHWNHRIGDSVYIPMTTLYAAQINYYKGDFKKAQTTAEKINKDKLMNRTQRISYCKLLIDIYSKLKKYDKVQQWTDSLTMLAYDSRHAIELGHIAEAHIQRSFDEIRKKTDAEKEEQQAIYESDITDKKHKLQGVITALCICFVLVIIALIYSKRKKTMNHLLEVKNQTLMQKQEEIIQQQSVITAQKEKVEQYNSLILQSIRYAQHIQRMALPDNDDVMALFPDSFLCFMPKDIVSGDFYYVTRCGDFNVMVIADCTGHGVPGGFLSMFGISAISEILARQNNDVMPGRVLDSMREFIKDAFTDDSDTDETGDESFSTADGMDMSICAINFATCEIRFAGAYHSAFVWSQGNIRRLKGDRMPIGRHIKEDGPFTTITDTLNPGDMLYMMTDGIQGQMGGLSGTKFMTKRLLQFFTENATLPCTQQKENFENTIREWMHNTIQVDDMTLTGIRMLSRIHYS